MTFDRVPSVPSRPILAVGFFATLCGPALAIQGGSRIEEILAGEVPPSEMAEDPIRAVLTAADPDVLAFDEHLNFLANPFLGGRLPGTQGMEIAKDYCEHHLGLAGVQPAFTDESGAPTFRQTFELATRRTLEGQSLSGGGLNFSAEQDFQVMSLGAPGQVTAPITFAGYSIDQGLEGYSSFEAGDDLTGRIAVVLRFEPMDESGNSLWGSGNNPWSPRAGFRRKLRDAADRGAAGILIVNTPGTNDPRSEQLNPFSAGRPLVDVPVAMVSAEAAAKMFELAGADLNALVAQANQGRAFQELDVEVELNADILEVATLGENVGGLLPGRGALADELIVIGGHLDHLGFGAFGSRDSGANRGTKVHPGADDNATGSAAILMLAERLRLDYEQNLPEGADARSILFVLFSGEESGLVGSGAYTEDPIRPLEDHALMMNFDMIGRLEGGRMNVSGTDTGVGMEEWAQPFFDSSPLEIVDSFGSRGGSDHLAFLQKRIPALFGICAELHDDYHTSRDTTATIHRTGGVQAMRLWHSLALSAALRTERFQYLNADGQTEDQATLEASAPAEPESAPVAADALPPVLFGINFGASEDPGVLVQAVTEGGAAQRAGILAGDRLLTWNGSTLASPEAMLEKLGEHSPGDQVTVTLGREGQSKPISLEVTLVARDSDG